MLAVQNINIIVLWLLSEWHTLHFTR